MPRKSCEIAKMPLVKIKIAKMPLQHRQRNQTERSRFDKEGEATFHEHAFALIDCMYGIKQLMGARGRKIFCVGQVQMGHFAVRHPVNCEKSTIDRMAILRMATDVNKTRTIFSVGQRSAMAWWRKIAI
jgi:hypothetical protein